MKKRLIAFLLVLIMVLGMLPVSAFAADVITLTYYTNDGTDDVFATDTATEGASHWLELDVPTRAGYDFLGWSADPKAKVAEYERGKLNGARNDFTFTAEDASLYGVWQETGTGPQPPIDPSKYMDQLGKYSVTFACADKKHISQTVTFAQMNTVSGFIRNWGYKDTCRLVIVPEKAVLCFDGHTGKDMKRTLVNFKWVNTNVDEATGKYLPGEWVMDETDHVVIEFKDAAEVAPERPKVSELGNVQIAITCRDHNEHNGTFAIGKCEGVNMDTVSYDEDRQQWYVDTYPMTRRIPKDYDKANKNGWAGWTDEAKHELSDPKESPHARFYYDSNTKTWSTTDKMAVELYCEQTPTPSVNTLGLTNVKITCDYGEPNHSMELDLTAEGMEPTINWTPGAEICSVTFPVAKYVAAYKTAIVAKLGAEYGYHEAVKGQTDVTRTYKLVNNVWTATDTSVPEIHVQCERANIRVYVKPVDSAGKDIDLAAFKNTDFGSNIKDGYYYVGGVSTMMPVEPMKDEEDGIDDNATVKNLVYQKMANNVNWNPQPGVDKEFTWAKQISFTEISEPDYDGIYTLYGQILSYKLTLDLDGGTLPAGTADPSGYYLMDTGVAFPTPVKAGYVFNGWNITYATGGDGGDIDDGDWTPGILSLRDTGIAVQGLPEQELTPIDGDMTAKATWSSIVPSKENTTDVKVLVKCAVNDALHVQQKFDLRAGTYTADNYRMEGDFQFCDLTVETAEYVKSFSEAYGTNHTAQSATIKFTLMWDEFADTPAWRVYKEIDKEPNVINVSCEQPIYAYFKPVNTEGETVTLVKKANAEDKDKTLDRLKLTYNSTGSWFTFGKLKSTSTELEDVKNELAKLERYSGNEDFAYGDKIEWKSLAMMKAGWHDVYNDETPGEAYHLDGDLTLYRTAFDKNTDDKTVKGMPEETYPDAFVYDYFVSGEQIVMPAAPSSDYYNFLGWKAQEVNPKPDKYSDPTTDADADADGADSDLLQPGDKYTITDKDVVFYAQWKKKTFTVKYYLPDETGAWVEKKMHKVDSVDYATYSLWTPNAEDGYEFSGWYQKTADIGVKAKVEKLYMAKEWKLYGKFTPIEYKIQYVYNDGKATSTNPMTYTVESDTIKLANATGADWGKTFLEWHDENGQKITEIPTGSTGDRVITAYWNWPVHLHYLDKDNKEIESATLYVSELEPGACVLPTGEKTGYDFDGWYEAKKDIGTVSNKLIALSIAKKWELYGRYTAKTDVSYTVKYLREGDNKVLAPEKVVTDQTFDTEVTEQAADVVGYTPDAPSKTMILDEYNKVLTFSYSANTYDYTVRHIKQLPDGSYDEANAEVETLSGKFEALAVVTAKDYGSHYPTNNADTKQNIKIEEGLTIDVKYDLDEHTLTFETNGGSAINPVTVRHGNAVARPADPTKDKYTFIGWYADPEFTEEYDFATVLEADKTIYAKFELTSTPIGDIYVRYDVLHIKQLPDGTYDLANAEVEHLNAKKDTTVTAVIKDYRATHHVNVNRTLSKLTDTAIRPYPGPDGKPVYTILTVYYDLDFHTLTFDTMGGSKIAPETVRHGLTVAKPKDPVNGGYIFDGWYTDKTFRHRYDFSTPLTEDITIYAKWFLIVLPGVTVKKNTPKLNTADHFAYVQGYPDGTVKPAGNITRAETAAILFRLMDDASRKTYYSTKSGFRDVASGSWYNTYVATLNNAGVITDSSNGYFRPNEAITRAELAAMLAKFSETTGAANYFNDVSAKYWAANAIAICAKLGWINGYPDGTFRPDKNVTRAELMAMINRATGRAPKSADAFLPGMKTWIDNTSDKWYYLDVQEATNSHSYTVKGSETWTALTSDPNWSLYE